jgi:ADP-dependent phosphofructokinase/glucokinase
MNIICAYPVNIDAVYNVRGEEISRFIPAQEMKSELKGSISSREDLISSLLYCMQQGSGAEILIESREAAEQIEQSFSWQLRLGGNAGIMANVLAALGARIVLNAPALGPRLAGMVHPQVKVPVSGILKEPALASGKEEMMHFIFQFKEGDEVRVPGNRITASRDNRFIATFDPVNTRLYSSPNFDAYCLENIGDFGGALLSGFHLAPYADYKEIFQKKIAQIESWKQSNNDIFVHAEMGSFQNQEIMDYLLPRLPADSLGLNEDELAGVEGSPAGWRETMLAAERLRERLGLFRVAVHTRDYILSIMREGLVSPEQELKALMRGTDAAAALAATGTIAGPAPLEVNPIGLSAQKEFRLEGANASGRGSFLYAKGVIKSLMPSLLARSPRFTVGLGDTATAAIFFEEQKSIIQNRSIATM